MPKHSLNIVRMKYTGIRKMDCNYCDFNTPSETGLKLHLKMRHNIANFKKNAEIIKYCVGCKKEDKNCICKK